MLNDCSIFQETFQWQNCNNWVKSNAKKKKTKQKIEYRDNKSANSLMYLKIRFWRGEGKKEGQKNIEKKKKRSWSTMDPLKAAVAVGKTGNGWKLVFPELLAAFGTVFTLDVHDRACRKSHARDKRGRKRGWKTLSLWAWFSRFDTHIHLVSLFIYMLHIINIYIYVYKCIYIYMQSCVCSMQQQQLRPSLSCRVLRFSSW